MCPGGGGCGGSTLRLVVDPGGTITRHAKVETRFTTIAPPQCDVVDAGPMRPGKYVLRATAHLAGWLVEGPGKHDERSISVPIEVTP
jgi:hypothetical protein